MPDTLTSFRGPISHHLVGILFNVWPEKPEKSQSWVLVEEAFPKLCFEQRREGTNRIGPPNTLFLSLASGWMGWSVGGLSGWSRWGRATDGWTLFSGTGDMGNHGMDSTPKTARPVKKTPRE